MDFRHTQNDLALIIRARRIIKSVLLQNGCDAMDPHTEMTNESSYRCRESLTKRRTTRATLSPIAIDALLSVEDVLTGVINKPGLALTSSEEKRAHLRIIK